MSDTRHPFAVVVTDRGNAVGWDVLDRFATKAESDQIVTQDRFTGTEGLVAPRVDPARFVELLDLNTPHLAACRQRAQDTAGMGWRLDKVDADATDQDHDVLQAFFDAAEPAPHALVDDSRIDVFKAASFDHASIGRGVMELVRRNKDPRGPLSTIAHLPAHTVRVHADGIRFQQHRHGSKRWFKWAGAGDVDVHRDLGSLHPVGSLDARHRANELVWWRNEHPGDPVYGLPDVIPAVGAIAGDVGRRDFNLEFFSNFGVPAYLVTVTGDFDPGPKVDEDGTPDDSGKTRIEWTIQEHFDSLRKHPHSTMSLVVPTAGNMDRAERVDVKIQPISTDVKEASFRMYRKDNREEVLSSHRMSSAMAGVFDAGAANREAMALYKRAVIAPAQRELEEVVNRYVVRHAFGIEGWRWRLVSIDTRDVERELDVALKLYGVNVLSRLELREKFAEYLGVEATRLPEAQDTDVAAVGLPSLLQQKVVTRNEGRRMLGLPPVEGGDSFADVDEVAGELRNLRDDLVRDDTAFLSLKAVANGAR